jgi:hypothetical protein
MLEFVRCLLCCRTVRTNDWGTDLRAPRGGLQLKRYKEGRCGTVFGRRGYGGLTVIDECRGVPKGEEKERNDDRVTERGGNGIGLKD